MEWNDNINVRVAQILFGLVLRDVCGAWEGAMGVNGRGCQIGVTVLVLVVRRWRSHIMWPRYKCTAAPALVLFNSQESLQC